MVIAILSQKGGVGKSITAIYLSRGLTLRGHSVAALDNDLGQQTLSDFAPALPGALVLPTDPRDLKAIVNTECCGRDFVIIDCGFGISDTTLPALELADIVLVPCIPDSLELRSTEKFLKLLARAGHGDKAFVLMTKVKSSMAHASAVEAALAFSGDLVIHSIIPQRAEFERANKRNTTLLDAAPESKGALAYSSLVSWVENHAQK